MADGVFYAELNEFFQRELAEEGYSGVEVRVTPTVTDISAFAGVPCIDARKLIAPSHSRYPHPGGPRRAGPPHSRAHLAHSKTFQISREFCLSLRCQGTKPWSFRCCTMRIPALQITQRFGCEEGVLWCPTFHHGEWCKGL